MPDLRNRWSDAVPIGGCKPPKDASEEDKNTYAQALAMAAEYLNRWTDGRFGVSQIVIYPCEPVIGEQGAFDLQQGGGSPWSPVLIGGKWFNTYCGYCGSGGCLNTCRHDFIRLPGPIVKVVDVVIGGETLHPDAYRVIDNTGLLRIDGGSFPTTQTYDVGGFTIEYQRGVEIPEGGLAALGSLACEMYKALTGDSSCQLPKRLQSITREGITMTLLDGFDSLASGYTGIWLVDSWISSINQAPRKRANVMTPDYNYRGGPAQGVRIR